MLKKPNSSLELWARVTIGILALIGLSAVYLFQGFDYANWLSGIGSMSGALHPYTVFVINKSVRYFLNDSLCLLLIYSLFQERKYVVLGGIVEIIGLIVVLPIYFTLKLSFEGDTELSSPLFSFLHRLIINPTLMILLIAGLIFQNQGKLTNNR